MGSGDKVLHKPNLQMRSPAGPGADLHADAKNVSAFWIKMEAFGAS